MCDYSLMHIASRPAQVGDKLVSTRFHNSISRAFAAAGEPNVPVGVLPGPEIAFAETARPDNFPTAEVTTPASRAAGFRQVTKDQQHMPHTRWSFRMAASCC